MSWRHMGEWRYSSNFLTSALDGGEWSTSRPGCFTPCTHWIGGWVGPRGGLDAVKWKSCPARNRTWAAQPVAIPTELSRLTSSLLGVNNLLTTYVSNTVWRKSKASIIIDHSVRAKPLLDISKQFARWHKGVGVQRPVRERRRTRTPLHSPSDEEGIPGAESLLVQLASELTWPEYKSQEPTSNKRWPRSLIRSSSIIYDLISGTECFGKTTLTNKDPLSPILLAWLNQRGWEVQGM
jgi:hypothetical protein